MKNNYLLCILFVMFNKPIEMLVNILGGLYMYICILLYKSLTEGVWSVPLYDLS